MLGLPDVVGWETLRAAVQSYNNRAFKMEKRYTRTKGEGSTRANAKSNAHEFFDRVAHFHDEALKNPELAKNVPAVGQRLTGEQIIIGLPAIILSLPEFRRNLTTEQRAIVTRASDPDAGLFASHFKVQTTPLNNVQQASTPRPQAPAPTIPTTTVTPPPQAENSSDLIFQQPRATFQPRATTSPAPTTAPRPQSSGTFFDRR